MCEAKLFPLRCFMNGVSNMRYFIQRIRPEDINISFLQMAYNKSFLRTMWHFLGYVHSFFSLNVGL